MLHTGGIVGDMQCCDCAEELEVSEEETVPKPDVSWLRSLCAGPCRIKDTFPSG